MKGTILACLEKMVITNFGKNQWEKSLKDAGLKKSTQFLPISDIDDTKTMKIIEALCKNLNISIAQIAEAFGDYWVNVYSQKMYGLYYKTNKTVKDLLLDMDHIHFAMTKTMKNARPPRFDYEWENDKTLIMHYKSHRNLIDFLIGIVKGVGNLYQENIKIIKLGHNKVRILFS